MTLRAKEVAHLRGYTADELDRLTLYLVYDANDRAMRITWSRTLLKRIRTGSRMTPLGNLQIGLEEMFRYSRNTLNARLQTVH